MHGAGESRFPAPCTPQSRSMAICAIARNLKQTVIVPSFYTGPECGTGGQYLHMSHANGQTWLEMRS